MRRTIIGGFLFLGGLLVSLGVIISASIYATNITSWSGKSKLWFALFGAEQYDGEIVDSLFLGFPFVVGIILAVLGIAILSYEYYESFVK